MRLTHIAPLSVGKVAFVLYGCLGLIACIFFVPMMLLGAMGDSGRHAFPFGAAMGVGMVVVLPLFYATIGALFAMLGAFIYNLVAGMVGGVEITIEPAPVSR
jgi:hypothetical protein